jgi:hypothetical protein
MQAMEVAPGMEDNLSIITYRPSLSCGKPDLENLLTLCDKWESGLGKPP